MKWSLNSSNLRSTLYIGRWLTPSSAVVAIVLFSCTVTAVANLLLTLQLCRTLLICAYFSDSISKQEYVARNLRKGFTFTRHDPRTEHGTETRLRRALPTPCDTIAKSIRIKPRGNHNENEQIPRDSHGTAYSDSGARRPISRRPRAWRQEMSLRGRRRQAQHCGGGRE
jgi:hypothetical protein